MEVFINIDTDSLPHMWENIKDQLPGFPGQPHLNDFYLDKLKRACQNEKPSFIYHDGSWNWNSTGRWKSIKASKGGVVIHLVYHGRAKLHDYL